VRCGLLQAILSFANLAAPAAFLRLSDIRIL